MAENLGKKFIEDIGLSGSNKLYQAIACEGLSLVAYNQYIKGSREEVRKVCYTDDFGTKTEDECLMGVLNCAGYWSNDLMDILSSALKKDGIDSPIAGVSSNEVFQWIHDWLIAQGYVYNADINK